MAAPLLENAGAYAAGKAKSAGRDAGRSARRARLPGDRRYQGVILAEFVAAVLIVALAPIARGKEGAGAENVDSNATLGALDHGGLDRMILAVGFFNLIPGAQALRLQE